MKILQLCRKFPFPLKDGESVAVHYLANAYQKSGVELTLLSFNTIKHFFDPIHLPPDQNNYHTIQTVYLNNHPTLVGAFQNLFSRLPYHITRFISAEFRAALADLLQKKRFDVVQMESVYFAPYLPVIRQLSDALVVMRSHNVEFEIWQRVAAETSWLPKKIYLNYLSKKLRRYEVAHLNEYDLLLAMTERDLNGFQQLGFRGKALVTPIGLDMKKYQNYQQAVTQPPALSFIGSLDWMPNQEGLRWFLEEVWYRVHQQFPDLFFHIAGRNTPQWVKSRAGKGVRVHGEVPDAIDFLKKYPISVVPLFSGSGMRVKILEGMALGRVVLTTSVGLEGIAAKNHQSVLIADDAENFVEKIKFCLTNSAQTGEIAQNARTFVEQHYDHLKTGARVLAAIRSLQSI